MSEQEIVRLAIIWAKKLARRWGLPPEKYRELIGGCWEGLARMPTHLEGPAVERAAYRGAVDYLRRISLGGWGKGRRNGVKVERRIATAVETLPEPRAKPADDARQRIRELWEETADCRRGWTTRQKEWAYLFVVEAWTLRDIGRAYGVSSPTVSIVLKPLARKGEFARLAVARRGPVAGGITKEVRG